MNFHHLFLKNQLFSLTNIKGPSWSDSFLLVIVSPRFPLFTPCGSTLTVLKFHRHAHLFHISKFLDRLMHLAWNGLSSLGPLTNFSSVSENFINITLYMYLPTAIPTQSTEIPYMPALTFFSSCSSLQHGGPQQSSDSLKDVLVIFISVF